MFKFRWVSTGMSVSDRACQSPMGRVGLRWACMSPMGPVSFRWVSSQTYRFPMWHVGIRWSRSRSPMGLRSGMSVSDNNDIFVNSFSGKNTIVMDFKTWYFAFVKLLFFFLGYFTLACWESRYLGDFNIFEKKISLHPYFVR